MQGSFYFFLEVRKMRRQRKEKHILLIGRKNVIRFESLIFVLVLPVAKINKEYGGERVVAAR